MKKNTHAAGTELESQGQSLQRRVTLPILKSHKKESFQIGAAVYPTLGQRIKLLLHQRRTRLFILLILLIMAAAAGGGGYYWYRQSHRPKPVPPQAGINSTINRINSNPLDANASADQKAGRANELGALYAADGQTQAAIDQLLAAEKGYATPADKFGVWLDLAQAYEKIGNKKQAIEYYKKLRDFAAHPPEGDPDTARMNEFTQKIKGLGGE